MPIKTEQGDLKPIVYLGAINNDRLLIVKYKVPPNPNALGWWLPAPEIEFGQDPADEMVALVRDLGLELRTMSMAGGRQFHR
jgi:hypothetical protein